MWAHRKLSVHHISIAACHISIPTIYYLHFSLSHPLSIDTMPPKKKTVIAATKCCKTQQNTTANANDKESLPPVNRVTPAATTKKGQA